MLSFQIIIEIRRLGLKQIPGFSELLECIFLYENETSTEDKKQLMCFSWSRLVERKN